MKVVFRDPGIVAMSPTDSLKFIHWTVGDIKTLPEHVVPFIGHIQLSIAEATEVRKNFENIPMPKDVTREVNLFGDHARFIYANL